MELFKKFLSEFIGTFIFLSTIIVVVNKLKPNVNFLKIGLALSISIVIFGPISGGHFNPAVSYMFLIHKQLTIREFFVYIIGQVLGATLSLGLFKTLYS